MTLGRLFSHKKKKNYVKTETSKQDVVLQFAGWCQGVQPLWVWKVVKKMKTTKMETTTITTDWRFTEENQEFAIFVFKGVFSSVAITLQSLIPVLFFQLEKKYSRTKTLLPSLKVIMIFLEKIIVPTGFRLLSKLHKAD